MIAVRAHLYFASCASAHLIAIPCAATIDEVCGDERWGGVKDLDKPDQNGRTAILNAAFVYQLDLCLEFLDAGACVTALEPDTGSTMLHYLAKAREPASGRCVLLSSLGC